MIFFLIFSQMKQTHQRELDVYLSRKVTNVINMIKSLVFLSVRLGIKFMLDCVEKPCGKLSELFSLIVRLIKTVRFSLLIFFFEERNFHF